MLLGTLALAVLLLVIPRLGGPPSWSVFYLLHEWPAWVRTAAILAPLPLALLIHAVAPRVLPRLPRPPWLSAALPGLLGALAVALFWSYRETRHWGDADMTVAILEGRAPVGPLGRFFWREPLDRLLATGATALAGRLAGMGAEPSIALLSCLAGGVFVALLVPLARSLAETGAARAFLAAFTLSMGASQLFFGHVENYTLVTTAMLAFFWSCAEALRGRASVATAGLLAALAVTVHAQAAFLIAPLLALVVSRPPPGGWTPARLLRAALPGAAWLVAFYLASRALGAPPLDVGVNRYAAQAGIWMSPAEIARPRHLWNVLQGYVLTLPFGAFLVLGGALLALRRGQSDPMARLLLWASLSFGVFALCFDAELPRRMDWSLFAPGSLPVTLLAAHLFARRLDRGDAAPVVGTFLVLLSLGLSASWIASNHVAGPGAPP